MSIGQMYLKIQEQMEHKYGEKVIVMMEIGKFYEIYGYEMEDGTVRGAAKEMSRLCNIILTRKNKNLPSSMTNPLMCGFPNHNLNKYVSLMVRHRYTVAVYDQQAEDSSQRHLRAVYSPSVMIGMDEDEEETEDRSIMAVIVDHERISMAHVNLSNGRVMLEDDRHSEDRVRRLVDLLRPQELVWRGEDDIFSGATATMVIHRMPEFVGEHRRYQEMEFQEIFLSGLYPGKPAMMSTIEYLGLERNPDVIPVLCFLLSFLKEHHPLAVYRLQSPCFEIQTDKMLYNLQTLYDLNLLSTERSLLDILDCTATAAGRRLFRRRLLSPVHSIEILEERYREIEMMSGMMEEMDMHRLQTIDMEHYYRRFQIGTMTVPSVFRFLRFATEFRRLCEKIPTSLALADEYRHHRASWIQMEEQCAERWDQPFMQTWKSWENGIWRVTPEGLVALERESLAIDFRIREWVRHEFSEEMISRLVFAEDEAYLQVTKKMAREIRMPKDVVQRTMAQNVRLQHPFLDTISHERRRIFHALMQKRRQIFEEEVQDVLDKNQELLPFIVQFSARLDVILSNARNYQKYRLVRPKPLDPQEKRILRCNGLRHLIVEHANPSRRFVPNNIELGGMLLFGQNSAGKCFLKGTPMVLWDGRLKRVEELTLEDRLIGDDGRPRRILRFVHGQGLMYDIVRTDTSSLLMTVNGDHILCLTDPDRSRIVERSVDDILRAPATAWMMHQCTGADMPSLSDEESLPTVWRNEDRCTVDRGAMDSDAWRRLYRVCLHHGRRIASFTDARLILDPVRENIVPIRIVPRGEDAFFGFGLDDNQRFLMPDGTLAHNSTLMKSVGVAIVMAQSGMYVPSASMEWSPIRSLFTKIGSRDNIWKGRSTFITEMNELRHILNRSDPHSLILCDELTAGTETFSATGIVAATIRRLLEKQCRFVLTTHLHTLKNFQELMEDPRLQVKHLSMEYDASQKSLVFDRILRDGFGRSIYGLEIAEYLGFDPEFLEHAFKYRARLDEEPILRPSRYNRKKWMERCERCGAVRDLHTHHIQPQISASPDGYIGEYHKNTLFNLMTLCRTCHEKEHHQ